MADERTEDGRMGRPAGAAGKEQGTGREKRWFACTFLAMAAALCGLAGLTAWVDPFFHYHKPQAGLAYPIHNQRYMNDGILRHFDYEAVITGTSMTENFKASDFERLWGVKTVKTPFSGGSYKEINDSLARILRKEKRVKYVVRCLDYSMLLSDKDSMRYEHDFYPWYLYDDIPWNDVKYVLNKSVLFDNTLGVLKYTKDGGTTTDFDTYSNWNASYTFGKEPVLKGYTRPGESAEQEGLSMELKERIRGSLEQNVLSLARECPDTTFLVFFSPYSIVYWDSLKQSGTLRQHIEAEREAIKALAGQENIELYSFSDCFELVCDLNNYKDMAHYSEAVNAMILEWMHEGEHRITAENYEAYLESIEEFYFSYEYDARFEGE